MTIEIVDFPHIYTFYHGDLNHRKLFSHYQRVDMLQNHVFYPKIPTSQGPSESHVMM